MTGRRFHPRARPGDAGSSIPLILLCAMLAALLVAAVAAASSAFLAQRDLQAGCDGAAVAAASGADARDLYTGAPGQDLPLDPDAALAAAQEHILRTDPRVQIAVTVAVPGEGEPSAGGTQVTVVCTTTVEVPFGALFGLQDGLRRTAAGSARAPLRS